MVFLVVMYGCESWTIKKAECQRTDASELWCWRRLLRVPWTTRSSNQSILKEISPECSLEELMLKLKLQYFSHLMWRFDSLEKTLILGKIEGRRRREWQRMRWWDTSPTRWTWVWVDSGSWWWTGRPGMLRFMGSQGVGHDWATELNILYLLILCQITWIGLGVPAFFRVVTQFVYLSSGRCSSSFLCFLHKALDDRASSYSASLYSKVDLLII